MYLHLIRSALSILSFCLLINISDAQEIIRSYAPDIGIEYNTAFAKFTPRDPLDTVEGKVVVRPKEVKESYNIHLGNLNYPLRTLAENYNRIQSCSFSDFLENLTSKIKLTKSDIPIYEYFIGINIYKYVGSDNSHVFYNYLFNEPIIMPLEENTTIPQYLADSIINNLDSLSLIKIDITRNTFKNYIGGLLLSPFGYDNISGESTELVYCYFGKNKWVKEVPIQFSRVLIPSRSNSEGTYGFQLLELNGQQYLKTDTLTKGSKSFLTYYKHRPEYRIIHLPGFKTRDRFVNLNRSLISPDKITFTNLDNRSLNDLVYLYDYNTVNESEIKLQIGDIKSTSIDYYLEAGWFLNNVNKGIKIITPDGEYVPYHIDIISYDTINKYHFISCDNLNNPAILSIIKNTPTPAKYYFQNILFTDNKGRKTRLNKSFAFIVIK